MATGQRGPFLPGSAIYPDGSASNLTPAIARVKSTATAPGRYFFQLNYDAATDEWACWSDRMPVNYASAPVAKVVYKMASATTGDVVLDVRLGATTPGDAVDEDAQDYGSANTATNTVPGTAGHTKEVSITLTNADSIAAGDLYSIRVARNGSSGSDTATGDLELLAVVIEYTTT